MPVEDVFTISGRGTVATGRVERGQLLELSEEVEIVGLTDEKKKTVITGIEMFRKLLDYAEAGDNVALCCAASPRPTSSAARFCPSPVPFIPTPSSPVRSTF